MPNYEVGDRALRDIDEIADYIAQDNVSAGRRFIKAAWQEISFIAEYPGAGTLREDAPKSIRGRSRSFEII